MSAAHHACNNLSPSYSPFLSVPSGQGRSSNLGLQQASPCLLDLSVPTSINMHSASDKTNIEFSFFFLSSHPSPEEDDHVVWSFKLRCDISCFACFDLGIVRPFH